MCFWTDKPLFKRGDGWLAWAGCALLLGALPTEVRGQDAALANQEPEPIVSSLPASPTVEMDPAGLLEINVRDAELAAVLEMLSAQTRRNIVASSSVEGRLSANLFGVTLEEALEAILRPNKLEAVRSGNTIFVGTAEEVAVYRPAPQTRIFKLRYITKGEAASAVRSLLGEKGGSVAEGGGEQADSGSGGGGSTASSGGAGGDNWDLKVSSPDYLLVTTDAERLARVEQLLREIDVRPRQVLIEATILRATLNESEELGIDFTLLNGVDFENLSSTSNAALDLTVGELRPGDFQDTTTNITTGFTGNVSPGGVSFGVISNNIGVFLRALEEVTDVTVVANPKVVALNRQMAEVIVGRRDGYLTTTVTETAAVQTVEFLETGTQIKVRPFINEDGLVRLMVHPKDSNGGLTAANLPFEETTEARAEILVRDGHTVLIGGLFRDRSVSSRSQTPVLGNVPIAGVLFQSHDDNSTREEVIVLLTVHVLKDNQQEFDANQELADDVERIRIGSRRGLAGIGRERLAQAYYQEAIEQLEEGDTEAALLNVRMALHNQPRHVAALKLSERLLGERLWHGEGTRMRTFALELIERERATGAGELPRPPFGRPPVDRLPADSVPTPADETDEPEMQMGELKEIR